MKNLKQLRDSILKERKSQKPMIVVSSGTCGRARGAVEVVAAFRDEIAKKGLSEKVDFKETGCHGFCEVEPVVVIHPQGIFYRQVKVDDVAEIISETVLKGKVLDRLLYVDPGTKERITYEKDVSFYKRQKRIILGNNEYIDPTDIRDYIALGDRKSVV